MTMASGASSMLTASWYCTMRQSTTSGKCRGAVTGNTGANADHQQHRPAMVLDVEESFLEGVLCFLRRTFRRGCGILCGFLRLPQLLCIVPFDPLFLQKAGYRVRSCQCRIIMQCLFPVCGLYGDAGEPGRFVPRLRLCRQVHQTANHL